MAIKVITPGLVDHRPGSRPARLLSSRHPALRRHGPLCAARRQPAGRQRRGRRRCSRPCSWGRSSSSPRTRRSPSPAPSCRRRSTARRARPGPSFTVKAGQVLSFDFLKAGARAYIAISGGIDVPVVLGSRSTYPLGALGGFKGRPLQAGDELPVGEPANGAKEGADASPEALRRVPGQAGRAADAARPLLAPHHRGSRRAASSTTPGRSRRKPTASAIASAAAGRSIRASASSRSAPAPIRPTSSTPAIPTARSRCRAAPSRSSSTATRSPAAAISWSAR